MRKIALLLASGVALTMIACGGDDEPDPTATIPAGGQTVTTTTTPAPTTSSAGTTAPPASPTRGTTTTPATNAPASPVATLPGGGTTPVVVPPVPTVVAGVAFLEDVRIGLHPETSSERIVFEFSGALPQARVEYVADVQQCAEGSVIPIAGEEVLRITFLDAAAHDSEGKVTFDKKEVAGGSKPITEAKQFCDFENELGWAAGITGMKPFIVSTLANPPRLVIDIKQ